MGSPLSISQSTAKPEVNTTESTRQLAPGPVATMKPEVNTTESNLQHAPGPVSTMNTKSEVNTTESNLQPGVQDQTSPSNELGKKLPYVDIPPDQVTKLEYLGFQRHRFGRDVINGGEQQQMQADADFAEAQSIAIQPGLEKAILLDDSRSLDRYELSDSIKRALEVKRITSLTPLQEVMVEKLVGQPEAWYIIRPKAPTDNNKPIDKKKPTEPAFEFVFSGAKEPKDLKEGESAQHRVIEVRARQDVICLAETGSGKTLSYLLPLYEHLLVGNKVISELHRQRLPSKYKEKIVRDRTATPAALPFALIVVPTRELAVQVYNEMVDLSLGTFIQPGALYGGTDRDQQALELSRGCDILVGTPGRIIDMLGFSYVDGVRTLSFENLSHMIWDEADELLSSDFAGQMKTILNMNFYEGETHHWFFSSQYLDEHIKKAEAIIDDKYLDISFDQPVENAAMRYALVHQNFIEVGDENSERFDALKIILNNNVNTKSLVLVKTHLSVEWIHNSFASLRVPFRSTHGGYSQERREEAMVKFKKGSVPILVSTMGISGRGLNLQKVDCLIFWDMPDTLEEYKWCLGRVGRLGNPAKAYVLATRGNNLKEDHRFAKFFQVSGTEFDLDVEGKKIEKKVEGDKSDVKGKGKAEDNSWDNGTSTTNMGKPW